MHSVAADLPRVLEVNKFTEARSLEVQALEEAVRGLQTPATWGEPALPRSLRRRTHSHNNYKHARRPNARLQAQRAAAQQAETVEAEETEPTQDKWGALVSRRMRRSRGRLQASFEASCLSAPHPDSKRRLESHVWHAKRFTMTHRWGTCLAEGLMGKGHGMKALLADYHKGCLMHDASYWCPVQLSGSPGSIVQVLQAVSNDPSKTHAGIEQLEAGLEVNMVLHQVDQQCTSPVGPVHAMLLSAGARGAAKDAGQCWHLAVWVHPAVHALSVAVLESSAAAAGVTCRHRTASWRRIEIRGQRSTAVLASLLDLNIDAPGRQVLAAMQPNQSMTASFPDPRLHTPHSHVDQHAEKCTQRLPGGFGVPGLHEWMIEAVAAPISQQEMGEMRRQNRLAALGLPAAAGADALPQDAQTCPVTIIRQHPSQPPFHVPGGWSLILPAHWVMPVWLFLVFQSAKACGQREWKWLHDEMRLAWFPEEH